MRCFARWAKDENAKVFFRDQTILQFGNSWDLLASFVLLNPGSSTPLSTVDQTELLRSQCLPYFVEPNEGERYVEFSIDRLMSDVLKIFSAEYLGGGTIRLYNLFNLKNQDSGEAVEQFLANRSHPKMFAADTEVKYCDAPVVVASGGNSQKNKDLRNELIRYISFAETGNLYKLAKVGQREFSIIKAEPDSTGFIQSYHPSYTFKYGNSTNLGELGSLHGSINCL